MMDRLQLRKMIIDLQRLRHGIRSPMEAVSPDPLVPTFPRWADRLLGRLEQALGAHVGTDLQCYFVRWDSKGRWAVHPSASRSILVAGNAECGRGCDSGSRDFLALDLDGASRFAQARARQLRDDLASIDLTLLEGEFTQGERIADTFSDLQDRSLGSNGSLTDGERIAARYFESVQPLLE